MPVEEAGTTSVDLPDYIDKSKLDSEYTSGEISKMFRVSGAPAPYIAIKKAGGQVVDDGYFDNTNDAKAWCNKHFNIGAFPHD